MNKILIGTLKANHRQHFVGWTFEWIDACNRSKFLTVEDDLSVHQALAFVGGHGWSLAYKDGDTWWFNKEDMQYAH